MNIAFSCDDIYVPYCGISIISLLENNRGEDITVYVVGQNLSLKSKESLYHIGSKYHQTIKIIDIDNELLNKCPPVDTTNTHFSMAVYIRLFFETIFSSIDKILFLDSDIIIKKNLNSLWNIDISNYSLGGILDPVLSTNNKRFNGYINAGILLINLDYWRKNNVQQKCIEYLNGNNIIEYNDQDAINHVLKASILHLPMKYNVQTSFYHISEYYDLSLQEELKEAISDATIIHFTAFKPWIRDSIHPELKTFRKYARLSEWKWKNISYWSSAIGNKSRRKFRFYKKQFLVKLGLREQEQIKF